MQDASVARLVDMGFGVEAACGALNLSKGLVDEAAHLLCTQPELWVKCILILDDIKLHV